MIARDSKFVDNTMLSAYKDCPRKYQLRHRLHWRSVGTSLPLIFGLSWHEAQDVIWSYYGKVPLKELPDYAFAKFCEMWEKEGMPVNMSVEQIEAFNPRTPMVALEMIKGYINARGSMIERVELLAVEQPFAVPLPGLDDFWYVGRLDKVIGYQNQTLTIEHKSTTEYKKDGGFKTSYIEGWYTDSQVKGYEYGGALFFPGMQQVWVDAALVHKTVHDKFRFVPVWHARPLLNEWIQDTLDWLDRIQKDIARDYFPKNENSCMGKFGPCPFLNICRTTSDPKTLGTAPEGYMVEKWEPYDLLHLDRLVNKETQ